jgi:hypothetical protein
MAAIPGGSVTRSGECLDQRHGSDRAAEHPEHRRAPNFIPRRQLTKPLMDRLQLASIVAKSVRA